MLFRRLYVFLNERDITFFYIRAKPETDAVWFPAEVNNELSIDMLLV